MPSNVLPHSHPDGHHCNPAPGNPSWRWYLAHFAHRLLDFRAPEVESAAQALVGVKPEQITWRHPPCPGDPEMWPFWHVTLPTDEAARTVVERTMLTKGLIELWGEGSSWEELRTSVESFPEERKEPWLRAGTTFKVEVEAYGRCFDNQQKRELLDRMMYIPFKGKVNMSAPEVTFVLCYVDVRATQGEFQLDETGSFYLYFGRLVGRYNHIVANQYILNQRPYIGPTSMDPEMAFIMCNQGAIKGPGQLVLDPYIGTGSIGVAVAHLGAQVMGADIDVRVIKFGKKDSQGRPVDVRSNFAHYGTQGRLAGLVRLDMHRHPFREGLEEVFHAILGDPPYGVRAGGRKSMPKDVEIRDRATWIPSTEPYSLGECLRDLLEFAARMLVVGGRLVYFMPATPETYREEEIPAHPALKLMYNSEQLLTQRYSRRLITMEKVSRYDAQAAAAYYEAHPDPTLAIDRIHDHVYGLMHERDGANRPIFPEAALNVRKHRGKMV